MAGTWRCVRNVLLLPSISIHSLNNTHGKSVVRETPPSMGTASGGRLAFHRTPYLAHGELCTRPSNTLKIYHGHEILASRPVTDEASCLDGTRSYLDASTALDWVHVQRRDLPSNLPRALESTTRNNRVQAHIEHNQSHIQQPHTYPLDSPPDLLHADIQKDSRGSRGGRNEEALRERLRGHPVAPESIAVWRDP
jgi:hypothetical protein